jgi:hypothetical protein
MDLRELICEDQQKKSDLGSCPMENFVISGLEPSCSGTKLLIELDIYIKMRENIFQGDYLDSHQSHTGVKFSARVRNQIPISDTVSFPFDLIVQYKL